MLDKGWLRSFILSVVKPMKSGKHLSQDADNNASMDNLFPEGVDDKFRLSAPFGFISGIPKGVTGFYEALFGSAHENIVTAWLHAKRPQPSGPGETILYSTDSSGASIKVKLTLGSDGTLTISSPVKTIVQAPLIELGSSGLEKILNGETFQTYFNQHTHIGNLGYETSPPKTPSDTSHLSTVVKAAK